MTVDGLEALDAQLAKLGRPVIRRIVEAGARRDEEEWRGNITGARHIRTGSMLESVGSTGYREFLDGGEMIVYPQGEDRKGVRNATKAYVINYGRKGRMVSTKRGERYITDNFTGDKFITGKIQQTEERVFEAMQAESDRILDEINK